MNARTKLSSNLPRGSLVALITPFLPDGSVDLPKFRTLIDWHIGQGTSGIVVAGTTGESSTLSIEEHGRLLVEAAQHAAGRIPTVAGVGANATSEAIALARIASEAGADALLSVVPYYNKPTQDGLFRHFSAQAEVTSLPLILYSVAGRTVVDFSVETVQRLAAHPNICGIKDASGDMIRAQAIASVVPTDFALYSGDDFTALPYVAVGGWGIISVTANVAPRMVADLCAYMALGQLDMARTLARKLHPLTTALFCESNPIAVKHAVSLLGLSAPMLRLPMTSLPPELAECVAVAMREAGLPIADRNTR